MMGRLFDCSSLNLRSVHGIKYIDLSLPIRRAKKMQKLNIKCLLPHVVSATKFSQMSEIDKYQDKELINLSQRPSPYQSMRKRTPETTAKTVASATTFVKFRAKFVLLTL